MEAAVHALKDEGMAYREASNVPVESSRRCVIGTVAMGAKPGPRTLLTAEEEDLLAKYLVSMTDMGYGLSREDVMRAYVTRMAYVTAERTGKQHPFKDESAGRGWYEGFHEWHRNRTLCSPQPLSYYRARCSNKQNITDFLAKLCRRFNLLSKPMQVYNADESGIGIVHKPGKVLAEVGRCNVYSVTSVE